MVERIGTKHLIIYGVATGYCVRATVLHALEQGFSAALMLGLSRGNHN